MKHIATLAQEVKAIAEQADFPTNEKGNLARIYVNMAANLLRNAGNLLTESAETKPGETKPIEEVKR